MLEGPGYIGLNQRKPIYFTLRRAYVPSDTPRAFFFSMTGEREFLKGGINSTGMPDFIYEVWEVPDFFHYEPVFVPSYTRFCPKGAAAFSIKSLLRISPHVQTSMPDFVYRPTYVWSSYTAEYGSTGSSCESCSWSAEQGK